MFDCRKDGEGARFKVYLAPRSSRDGIDGLHGDAVKIRVKAPPVDGKANEALIRFLAKTLGVGRKDVELVGGLTNRSKHLRVEGLKPEDVAAKLGVPFRKQQ